MAARQLAERVWFGVCLALGRLLRSGTYSTTRIVHQDGELHARKHRVFYAPLLVWIGGLLLRILGTGVRVLQQGDWEERERLLYRSLRRPSIRIGPGGALVLPCLAGNTLSALLEDPDLEEPVRTRAIELAVVALVQLHDRGFTHGDAMAENVMVDLEAGVAHWFDFETAHDPSRSMAWRRADDLRALLATSLLRTGRAELAGTLRLILDVYGDEGITGLLATNFASPLRRPLAFHLGQARLSLQYFREIDRLLRERLSRTSLTKHECRLEPRSAAGGQPGAERGDREKRGGDDAPDAEDPERDAREKRAAPSQPQPVQSPRTATIRRTSP